MKKKIEDYLHLYLGCQCDFRIKLPEQFSVMPDYQDLNIRVLHNALSGLADVKPILRPLSDMTEEERIGCKAKGTIRFSAHEITHEKLEPEQFVKLLSKGFDLFGLIEGGLAIDKTKMNEASNS